LKDVKENNAEIGSPHESLDIKIHTSLTEAFRRLFYLLRFSFPNWKIGLFSAVIMTIAGLLSSLSVMLIGAMLKMIMGPSEKDVEIIDNYNNNFFDLNYLGENVGNIVTNLTGINNIYLIFSFLAFIWFLINIFTSIFTFLGVYSAWKFQIKAFFNLQKKMFLHISRMSLEYFYESKLGILMSRVQNDIQVTMGILTGILTGILNPIVTIVIMLLFMGNTNVKLTLITVFVSSLSYIIISSFGKKIKRMQKGVQSQVAIVTSVIQEVFANIKIVKIFNIQKSEVDRYWKTANEHLEKMSKLEKVRKAMPTISEIISAVTMLTILLVGYFDVYNNNISIEGLLLFYVTSVKLIGPSKTLGNTIISIFSVLGASERIFETLEKGQRVHEGDKAIKSFKKSIEFKNVNFNYGKNFKIENLTINLKKSETIALVGPSGEGKSTIADLLLRLYDPVKGAILIDGIDVREYTLESYLNLFGVVTQETYLYNDTIINNITFGNSASMDEVIYAAKIANIHDFISNLPEQYFTIIGDRGVKLSGGQRQRLAIARAIYKKPDILVFDEATSALDNKSEKIVQKAIENVIKNCTTLIIAHRLSTVKNADKILVIDNGRIVESGKHKELINLNGAYKNLYDIHILEHEK